jgi:hypothetical protein
VLEPRLWREPLNQLPSLVETALAKGLVLAAEGRTWWWPLPKHFADEESRAAVCGKRLRPPPQTVSKTCVGSRDYCLKVAVEVGEEHLNEVPMVVGIRHC